MTAGSESQLAGCELKDLHRLRRTLKQAKRKKGKAASDALAAFTRQYDRSREIRLKRLSRIPDNIRCSQDLPVFLESAKIKDALQTAQVVIVAGETGSGKTTQLPKICLEAGFGHRGKIGHTQPRRLAAISVAERIAEEIGVEPGTAVGYQVRFNDKSDDLTTVKVMTDGILLSEIQQDRFLNQSKLTLTSGGGADIKLGGSITRYTMLPVAISGDDRAAQNRLTIAIKVKFDNFVDPNDSWEQSFSRFVFSLVSSFSL